MEKLILHESTEDQPIVILDAEEGVFKISGRSLPEDATVFYDPIIEWVAEYAKAPNEETIFEFRLDYMNSSSMRKVVKLLAGLETIVKQGKKVSVIWYYETGDEMMCENGEEVRDTLQIPFVMKSLEVNK